MRALAKALVQQAGEPAARGDDPRVLGAGDLEVLEHAGTHAVLRRGVQGGEQVEQSRSGNPFDDIDLMVARVDQLSRNEDLQEKLKLSHWDLIVVDEAHKLSASYFGNKINKTKRFLLGELLGSITRHFLLMTATPHNGKEEDFQLFMSLLDADRFYGKFRGDVHKKVDASDLMRRMVKEELVKFDGTPLFPSRYSRDSPVFSVNDTVPQMARRQALVRARPRRVAAGRLPGIS